MIKIQPIQIGYPTKTATNLKITILPFDTQATNCGTIYEFFSSEEIIDYNENGEEIITINYTKLGEGSYYLTLEEFENWGYDNVVVEDAVINHLLLVRI